MLWVWSVCVCVFGGRSGGGLVRLSKQKAAKYLSTQYSLHRNKMCGGWSTNQDKILEHTLKVQMFFELNNR